MRERIKKVQVAWGWVDVEWESFGQFPSSVSRHPGLDPGSRCLGRGGHSERKAGPRIKSGVTNRGMTAFHLNRPVWRTRKPWRNPIPSAPRPRSEEHTSELQSLMRISYAVFSLKKKK